VTGAPPALEARGLSKAFGGVRAVDDVSFSVRMGSITAIIRAERRREDDALQPAHEPRGAGRR